MRSIISQEELEKKKKRNMTIFSIIIFGVLVFGTVGYALMDRAETSTGEIPDSNEAFSVIDLGSSWRITYNGQVYLTSFAPEEVKNISISTTLSLQDLSARPLFIASKNDAIASELASALERYTPRAAQRACYGPCAEDLPEKNCSSNLIVWTDSPNNQVYQTENCIFINGDLRAVDAFIFDLLEIPQN
jgi:hypothetical protein